MPPTRTGTASSDAASEASSSRAICAYASSDSFDGGSATSSKRCSNPRICDGLILLVPMFMPEICRESAFSTTGRRPRPDAASQTSSDSAVLPDDVGP